MPIRRRTVTSNPQAFNEDKHLRIALKSGLDETCRERAEAVNFGEEISDERHMRWDRRIAWYKRMLKREGLLALVPED